MTKERYHELRLKQAENKLTNEELKELNDYLWQNAEDQKNLLKKISENKPQDLSEYLKSNTDAVTALKDAVIPKDPNSEKDYSTQILEIKDLISEQNQQIKSTNDLFLGFCVLFFGFALAFKLLGGLI